MTTPSDWPPPGLPKQRTPQERLGLAGGEALVPLLRFRMVTKYLDGIVHPVGRIVEAGEVESWGPTKTYREMLSGGGYSIVYVSEGKGTFRRSDGLEREVTAGDMIFIFPEFYHGYGGGDHFWKEEYIWFEGEVIEQWRRAGILTPNRPVIRLEPVEYWLRRLQAIFDQPEWPSPSMALTRFTHLLYVLADALHHEDLRVHGLENQRWVQRACQIIDSAATGGTIDWGKVAANLKMSPEGFRRKFTRFAKITPSQYHRQAAIRRATELLQDLDRTIGEVAEDVGFCDQFHFSHQFKKMMKISPTEFRKRFFDNIEG